ncbi:MAG: bifunctional 3,4-dihydroxy-2-butanone-4-phosphate synthase/GTP cyclohydrolase II [Phycisphaerales bacterium]
MLSPIEEILDELRAGRMIVLTDDEDRENEGDLVLPAQFVTPEAVTFMLTHARGYLCVSLTEHDCNRLELTPQSPVNTSVRGTPFTVSVDGHPRHGFTTGVSARERAKTIQMLIDPGTRPSDFVRPGHVNPLRSRDGGVLVRIGQTEGSLDLCRLAGLYPAACIIEIMGDDGEMLRGESLAAFCRRHGLKMCTIRQIIEYRLGQSHIIERMEPKQGTEIATPMGRFRLFAFRALVDPLPHLALTVGDVGRVEDDGGVIGSPEPTLVRVHRRDLLGDIFDDLSSGKGVSTGQILRASMQRIQQEGRGVLVYLRPSTMGDDLSARLSALPDRSQQDSPHQSVSPAMLEYGVGSQILRALGLSKLRLLTNSDVDYPQLRAFGLEIVERVAIAPDAAQSTR